MGKGECIALIGPNGSGKSTLLNTIAGLLCPASGKIIFMGKECQHRSPYEIARLGISLIPETKAIFPQMTVMDNLLTGAQTHEAWNKKNDTLEWIFQLFPRLNERKNQKARTLSGGEMQMLNLGIGMMSRPKILLLDEPSLGLAPNLVIELFKTLKRINEEGGICLLLAEQHIYHSLNLSCRGYLIEGGKIVMQGDSIELLNNKHIKENYLGM